MGKRHASHESRIARVNDALKAAKELLLPFTLSPTRLPPQLGAKKGGRKGTRVARAVSADPRHRRLRQPGHRLADRLDRPLSPCPQPGQLLGLDTSLEQLRRCHATLGLDHQGRQRDRAVPPGPDCDSRVATRCGHEGMVSTDQEAAGGEDGEGGRDTASGNDHLVHGQVKRRQPYRTAARRLRATATRAPVVPDANAFLKEIQGRSRSWKAKGRQGHETVAAATSLTRP